MNVIDMEVKLTPGIMKLYHCNGCDSTWATRKKPDICPQCGAKASKIVTATEEQCESFISEYGEALAKGQEDMSEEEWEKEWKEEQEENRDEDQYESRTETQPEAKTGSPEEEDASYEYEPIGYNPDSYAEEMVISEKISADDLKTLLAEANQTIRDTKWALNRAGLPSDHLQSIKQDIASQGKSLGVNIPLYTELMMKMAVDTVLQQELRHPRKGRFYDTGDIDRMLSELDISEIYYESYYAVAGLR